MATAIPAKIILRSTTNISLSERFGSLQNSIQNVRAKQASERRALTKRQRFARQMANRPMKLLDDDVQFQMQEEDFRTSALLRLGVSRREPVRGRQSSGRRGGRGRGRSAIAPYDDRYGQSVIKIISTGQPVVRGRGSRRRRRGRGQGGTPSNLLYTQNDYRPDYISIGGRGRGRSKRGGNSSRNLGRRMGSWRGGRQPTRHQLDKQLDTYMSGNDS